MSEHTPRAPRNRLFGLLAVILTLVLVGSTARLFVWPEQGMPSYADAIVKLGGLGDRDGAAQEAARMKRAPVLVVATVPVEAGTTLCAPEDIGVKVICFNPDPETTRGEARFVGQLAEQYRWRSIVLITTPDQAWRARLRVQRCFDGEIFVSTTPLPAAHWVWAIPYQWLATIKALAFETDC